MAIINIDDPIDGLDDAHDEMIQPTRADSRLTYIQVRANTGAELLKGIGAAGEHVGPGQHVVGIDLSYLEADDQCELATIVIQHMTDWDGWTLSEDGSHSLRVITAGL